MVPELETRPSVRELRENYGAAHDAVIPEAKDRPADEDEALKEYLELWRALLEAHEDPLQRAALAAKLDQARARMASTSQPAEGAQAALMSAAGRLLESIDSGGAGSSSLDDSSASLEALAAQLGADYVIAWNLHLQFKREAEEELRRRELEEQLGEATARLMVAADSERVAAAMAAEAAGEAAARALQAAHAADAHERQTIASARADEAAEGVTMSGYLAKAGDVNIAFKKRFLALSRRELAWYPGEEAHRSGALPKGFVRMAGATLHEVDCPGKFRFAIAQAAAAELPASQHTTVLPPSLMRGGRTLVLEAPSQDEMDKWIAALQHASAVQRH